MLSFWNHVLPGQVSPLLEPSGGPLTTQGARRSADRSQEGPLSLSLAGRPFSERHLPPPWGLPSPSDQRGLRGWGDLGEGGGPRFGGVWCHLAATRSTAYEAPRYARDFGGQNLDADPELAGLGLSYGAGGGVRGLPGFGVLVLWRGLWGSHPGAELLLPVGVVSHSPTVAEPRVAAGSRGPSWG